MAAEVIEISKVEQQAMTWKQRAEALVIATQQDAHQVGELLQAIKDLQAQAHEAYDDSIARWHAGHKAEIAKLKELTEPLDAADRTIRSKLGTYLESERKRVEAEERAAREEAERLRLEEIEAAVEQVEAEGGSVEEVQAVIDEAQRMPVRAVAAVVAPPPKIHGVGLRKTYRAVVTNFRVLCAAVAKRETSEAFVMANQKVLDATARAQGTAFSVPGVRIEEEAGLQVRRR